MTTDQHPDHPGQPCAETSGESSALTSGTETGTGEHRPWTEDPEFVTLYDVENAGMWDTDFYRDLLDELGVQTVADIGCGTGGLALELAAAGIRVTGVEPAGAMIQVARQRIEQRIAEPPSSDHPGAALAERITLIHGYADQLESGAADAAVMVGHVAQYFLHRSEWDQVLAEAFRALRPGGWLAFESRNPAALELDAWDEESTRETQPHPGGGEFTSWLEVLSIEPDDDDGDLITCRAHSIMPDGRKLSADEPLRYRPLHVLRASLEQAGFVLEQMWGDWDRSELDEDSPEIIILARKPAASKESSR